MIGILLTVCILRKRFGACKSGGQNLGDRTPSKNMSEAAFFEYVLPQSRDKPPKPDLNTGTVFEATIAQILVGRAIWDI